MVAHVLPGGLDPAVGRRRSCVRRPFWNPKVLSRDLDLALESPELGRGARLAADPATGLRRQKSHSTLPHHEHDPRPCRPWLCRESGRERFLLDLGVEGAEALRYVLLQPRLERAIGVIYHPETELLSDYFEAQLPRQFDAWLWFEETSAVTPLGTAELSGAPETYPFGL
jgi:hypothetical protein